MGHTAWEGPYLINLSVHVLAVVGLWSEAICAAFPGARLPGSVVGDSSFAVPAASAGAGVAAKSTSRPCPAAVSVSFSFDYAHCNRRFVLL